MAVATPQINVTVAFENDPFTPVVKTDISAYVISFTTRRGRQGDLSTFASGQATLVLDNRDRRFEPFFASSPYFPFVLPMRLLNISISDGTLFRVAFTGYIDLWQPSYTKAGVQSTCTVTASDAFKVLSNKRLAHWAGEVARSVGPATVYYRLSDSAANVPQVLDDAHLELGTAQDVSGSGNSGVYKGLDGDRSGMSAGEGPFPDRAKSLKTTQFVSPYVLLPATVSPPNIEYDYSMSIWGKHSYTSTTGTALWRLHRRALEPDVSPLRATDTMLIVNANLIPGRVECVFGITGFAGFSGGLNDGKWHHYVVTYNAALDDMFLYVDGVAVGSSLVTPYVPQIPGEEVDFLIFSASENVGSVAVARDVEVSDFSYFTKTLNSGQVTSMFNSRFFGAVDASGVTLATRVADLMTFSRTALSFTTANSGGNRYGPADVEGQSVLQALRDLESSEAGFLFMSRLGVLSLFGRNYPYDATVSNTVQSVWGELAGEVPYSEVQVSADDEDLVTEVAVTSGSGAATSVSDSTAATKYGLRTFSTTTQARSLRAPEDLARWILRRQADVTKLRVEEVTFQVTNEATALSIAPLDLMHRVDVRLTPPGTGARIVQQAHITNIAWQFDARRTMLSATFRLSTRDIGAYWRLNVAGLGELGTTTVMGY